MNLPALVLGFVIASLYGLIFHVWRNGGPGRILLYLILAWLGFAAGHFGGNALGWSFAEIGALNAGMGTLGAAAFLFVGHWLSLVDVARS